MGVLGGAAAAAAGVVLASAAMYEWVRTSSERQT